MGLTDQWIECFRAGDYADKGKFSDADIEAIAATYSPTLHEAPVVIGHPADDAPALGWIEKLKASNGVLLAKLRSVAPELENMVSRGMYKKRSIALYPAFAATGKPYVKHVGFLGAMPPFVKGMADVSFSDSRRVVSFEFAAPGLKFNASPGIVIDPDSVRVMQEAKRYAAANGVEFGEALRETYRSISTGKVR